MSPLRTGINTTRITGWLWGLACCAIFIGIVCIDAYDSYFGWNSTGIGFATRAWIVAVAGSQIVWLLALPLLLAWLLGTSRGSALIVFASVACSAAWLNTDLFVWRVTGNNLLEYASTMTSDAAWSMGGGNGLIYPLGREAVLGASIGVLVFAVASFGMAILVRSIPRLKIPVLAASSIMLAVFLSAHHLLPRFVGAQTTLQFSQSLALPLISRDGVSFSVPGGPWQKLDEWLEIMGPQIERSITFSSKHVPVLKVPPVKQAVQRTDPERASNILVIVVESLRSDSLVPELMPRLAAWSNRGLRLERHYSTAHVSSLGVYSLLYGRSPTTYEATLDAGAPSTLTASMRRAGFKSSLFCGVSMEWWRMEEFLSPVNFDVVDCRERGWWPQSDRETLSRAVDTLKSDSGHLVIVHLNSTHFPYKYPAEYERLTPTASLEGVTWEAMKETTDADDSFRRLWTNRYGNSLGFIDDIVADLLERIDTSDTLVVLTGDHGESFGDDGFWLHGSLLSDAQLRVPAAIVGPGVTSGTMSAPTSHLDIVPTILGALGAPAIQVASLPGADLREISGSQLAHRPLVFTNASVDYLRVMSGEEQMKLYRSPNDYTLRALGLMNERDDWLKRVEFPSAAVDEWLDTLHSALFQHVMWSVNNVLDVATPVPVAVEPRFNALVFPAGVILVVLWLRFLLYPRVTRHRVSDHPGRRRALCLSLGGILVLAVSILPLILGIRIYLLNIWFGSELIEAGLVSRTGLAILVTAFLCEIIVVAHLIYYLKLCYDGAARFAPLTHEAPLPVSAAPPVVVLIPACDEPPSTLVRSLSSLNCIRYPKCRVLLVENSRDPDCKRATLALASEYGVEALDLPNYGTKAAALNEARRYLGSDVKYLAVIDVDQVVNGDFISDLVPILEKHADLGWLQTPQKYDAGSRGQSLLHYAANQQLEVLSQCTLEGKDVRRLCPLLGTGYVLRLAALDEVGGWETRFINEDTSTSYFMQLKGWRGRFFPRVYTAGVAPGNMESLNAQQVRWSHSNTMLALEIFRGFFRRKKRPIHVVSDYLSFVSYEFIVCLIAVLALTPLLYLAGTFLFSDHLPREALEPLQWTVTSLYPFFVLLVLFPHVNLMFRGYPFRNVLLMNGLNASLASSFLRGVLKALRGRGGIFETTVRTLDRGASRGQGGGRVVVVQTAAVAVFVGIGTWATYLAALQPHSPFPWIVVFWSFYHSINATHVFMFKQNRPLALTARESIPGGLRLPRRYVPRGMRGSGKKLQRKRVKLAARARDAGAPGDAIDARCWHKSIRIPSATRVPAITPLSLRAGQNPRS